MNLKAEFFLSLHQLLIGTAIFSHRLLGNEKVPPKIELLSLGDLIVEVVDINHAVTMIVASINPITEEIATTIKARYLKYAESHPDDNVNLYVYGAQSTVDDYHDRKPYILPKARKLLKDFQKENPGMELTIKNMRSEFGFK